MTQPTAANAKLVDKSNNPQIQDRQAAITRLTDSTGGTATDTLINAGPGKSDDIASLNAKLIEILDVLRYHGLIAGGTQVAAAVARMVDKDNNPQLGERQTAITAITDNSTGTATDVLDDFFYAKNQFASFARDINLVLDALEYHGLITGSGTQVTEAASKMVDKSNVPQIGVQQSAIADLIDSTGGSITDIIDDGTSIFRDDTASVAAKLSEIIELLELHGLIADN